jgi:hypothetical protein
VTLVAVAVSFHMPHAGFMKLACYTMVCTGAEILAVKSPDVETYERNTKIYHRHTMTRILVPQSALEFTITCLHHPFSVSIDRVVNLSGI